MVGKNKDRRIVMVNKQHGSFVDRTGEKHITNEGYEVEIIEYFNFYNCTIRFNNGCTVENICIGNVERGNIKNPYHPSVYEAGFLGIGKFKSKINTVNTNYYSYWISMLSRCYNKRLTLPTYKDVNVCKEWKCFQNFAKWFEDNWKTYMQGWQLDKDILQKGNKIYSPETCCFVPVEINSLFIKADKSRGEYPIGVNFNKRNKNFTAQINKYSNKIHLGSFSTPEEAFEAYKTAKEEYIKEVADKWRGQITEQVYKAMYNYKVEIID